MNRPLNLAERTALDQQIRGAVCYLQSLCDYLHGQQEWQRIAPGLRRYTAAYVAGLTDAAAATLLAGLEEQCREAAALEPLAQ